MTKAYADVVDVLQQPALASGNNFKKMQFESRKADFHAAYAELLRVRQTGGQSAEAEVAFARASKHLRLHLHPDKAEAGEQKLFNEATQRLGQLEAVLLRKESE
ncbi:MAG TPA: hypothetical protein VFV39_04250 [Limnobacter sp.]|nr:hypothetical protein [Limnobacter sp.]